MVRAADVLSAASLLLTAVTVLFGLWRGDIDDAVDVSVPPHLQDAGLERSTVRDAIRYRVWPLLVATSVVIAAFLPVLVNELVRSARNVADKGWGAWQDYDPSAVAMAGVVVLLSVLEGTLLLRLTRLRTKWRALQLPE